METIINLQKELESREDDSLDDVEKNAYIDRSAKAVQAMLARTFLHLLFPNKALIPAIISTSYPR